MIIPEIMPDELGIGYLIRLSKINGYQNKKITIEKMRKKFMRTEDNVGISISILLSRALGISTEQFCRFHTILPALRSVTSHLPYIRHGDISQPQLIKTNTNFLFKNEFKACSKCVHEDIEYHGFSYYRREHQLPGFDFCSKHSQKLVRSAYENYVNPDEINLIQSDDSSNHCADEFCHEAILRYRTILDAFANAETPIPQLHILDLLQSRARAHGLFWTQRAKNKNMLSDLVIYNFPVDWLEGFNIKANKKNIRTFFPSIDSLLTTSNKLSCGYLYALVLSVLYDNAEDALNASYDCITKSPRAVKTCVRISDKDLNKIYVESRGNACVIASKLGLDHKSVSEKLNKKGMLALGKTNKKAQLSFIDFQGGMGLMESCLKHGVELRALEQMLRISSSVQAEALRSIDAIECSV